MVIDYIGRLTDSSLLESTQSLHVTNAHVRHHLVLKTCPKLCLSPKYTIDTELCYLYIGQLIGFIASRIYRKSTGNQCLGDTSLGS